MGKYVSDALVVTGGELIDKYVETIVGPMDSKLFVEDSTDATYLHRSRIINDFIIVCKSSNTNVVYFHKVSKLTGEIIGTFSISVNMSDAGSGKSEGTSFAWCCDNNYIYLLYVTGYNVKLAKIFISSMSINSTLDIATGLDSYTRGLANVICIDPTSTYLYLSYGRWQTYFLLKISLSSFTIAGTTQISSSYYDTGTTYKFGGILIGGSHIALLSTYDGNIYFFGSSGLNFEKSSKYATSFQKDQMLYCPNDDYFYFLSGSVLKRYSYANSIPEMVASDLGYSLNPGLTKLYATSSGKLILTSGEMYDIVTKSLKYIEGLFSAMLLDISAEEFVPYAFQLESFFKINSISSTGVAQGIIIAKARGSLHKFEKKKVYI